MKGKIRKILKYWFGVTENNDKVINLIRIAVSTELKNRFIIGFLLGIITVLILSLWIG